MAAKPMKTRHLHYPMIQFLIISNITRLGKYLVDFDLRLGQRVAIARLPFHRGDNITPTRSVNVE